MAKPPSKMIDERIKELGDWRGKTLALICTGETYKAAVKMTFANGLHSRIPQDCSTQASMATFGVQSTSTSARRSARRH